VPVFPDLVRRAFALADREGALRDYRVEQTGEEWRVRLEGGDEARLRAELDLLARSLEIVPPRLTFEAWRAEPPHEKRRRIRCFRKPEAREAAS
jgi:hypothetical protein